MPQIWLVMTSVPAGGTPHRGLGTFGVDVVAARERKRPQCEN